MNQLKEAAIAKASSVIHYRAHFEKYLPREEAGEGGKRWAGNGEGGGSRVAADSNIKPASQILERRNAVRSIPVLEPEGEVRLGGMDELGLSVFEAVFNIISQTYSYARSSAETNPYHDMLSRQEKVVRSHCSCQLQVPGGSQESVLRSLDEFCDFVQIQHGDLVILVGPHGCGKTTLLSRFLADFRVVDVTKKEIGRQDHRFQAAAREVIIVNRLGKKLAGSGEKTQMSHEEWTELWAKTHQIAAQHRTRPSDIVPNLSELEPRYRIRLEKSIAGLHALQDRHVSPHEIQFRCREPEIHFYFKDSGEQTSQKMLVHLCSSLLRSCTQHASWSRLEELLNKLSSPQASTQHTPSPVLLVLDGLNHGERYQIRRIVLALQGRVRAVLSVDEALVRSKDRSAHAGLRGLTDTITIPPLAYDERKTILRSLLGQVFKRQPNNQKDDIAGALAERQAAGSPLYLQVVVAHFKAAEVLRTIPESPEAIGTDTLDIILSNFLPMAETKLGVDPVRWCFQILMSDPRGFDNKELRAMLLALASSEPGYKVNDMSDSTIRLLIESFQPFADTQARILDDTLMCSRACMREAYSRYYATCNWEAKAQAHFNSSWASMLQFAEQQDARLKQLTRLDTSHSDSGANNYDWFSSDEDEEPGQLHDADAIVDEITLQFGKTRKVINRALFLKWCSTLEVQGSREVVYLMDLIELLKLLRDEGIFPHLVTKHHVVHAFEKANNLSAVGRISIDTNVDAMDFYEFLHCMRILQRKSTSFLDVEYTREHLDVVCCLQAHQRGKRLRETVRATTALAAGTFKSEKTIHYSKPTSISLLVKCQALARTFIVLQRLRRKLPRRRRAHAMVKQFGTNSIKGRLRTDGLMARLQQRLIEIFDTVQDAFVFIDLDGNEQITMEEFLTGLERLLPAQDAQTAADFSKCGAVISFMSISMSTIDIFGFM
jgi:hypothetical protein